MRYYKPKEKELVEGLELEFYSDKVWNKVVWDTAKKLIDLDDLRIKYLDSEDFNVLGYQTKRKARKIQEVVVGYDGDKEVLGKETLYEEYLEIIRSGSKVGIFKPNEPFDNVVLDSKKHTVKNLTELRKILR